MIRRLAGRSIRIVHGDGCWNEPCPRIRVFSTFTSATNEINFSVRQENPGSNTETTTNVLSSLSNEKCMDYAKGWAWQQVLMSHRLHTRRQLKLKQPDTDSNRDPINNHHIAQDNDCILLLEHAPVYTLGRGASEEHLTFLNTDSTTKSSSDLGSDTEAYLREKLSRKYKGKDAARLSVDRRALEDELMRLPLRDAVDRIASKATPVEAPNGVPIFRVDRGGEVTFHGPNQLVVYPVFDLKRDPYKSDLHWFLRKVEEVVIQTLRQYDIESVRDDINTGVWVDQNKIAAVGVSASNWISSHGFALNVCPDLVYFDTSVILPCGIEGRGVTSIHQVLTERGETTHPSMQEVSQAVLHSMEEVFQIDIEKTAESI